MSERSASSTFKDIVDKQAKLKTHDISSVLDAAAVGGRGWRVVGVGDFYRVNGAGQ